jgi:hypothetical protein
LRVIDTTSNVPLCETAHVFSESGTIRCARIGKLETAKPTNLLFFPWLTMHY